jgi:hypothetical protein
MPAHIHCSGPKNLQQIKAINFLALNNVYVQVFMGQPNNNYNLNLSNTYFEGNQWCHNELITA